jgi:hypothetical protein
MKPLSLALLVTLAGCATAQPVISPEQQRSFEDMVRQAEAAGAASEPQAAVEHLRDAKSEFAYARRVPRDPAHARRLLAQAQRDAELALALARHHLDEQNDRRATGRREEKAAEAAPSASSAYGGEAAPCCAASSP